MDQIDINIFIVIGVIFSSSIVVFFIYFIFSYRKKQFEYHLKEVALTNQLEQAIINTKLETQEETLSILSKELHDNVAQLLSTTKMLLGVTERNLENPPDTLIVAEDTLSRAISELRSLAKSLDKDWLAQFNCIDNLTAEVARINASKKLTIGFKHPIKLYIDADKQIVLFRIIQEAIQNTLKHANANIIAIVITENDQLLTIAINDDGLGFNVDTIKKGMGILNIEHRTRVLGGTVQFVSNTNGTKIYLELPVEGV